MKHVAIYTDGACSGNPGPGGYGAVLVYEGREKELSGGAPHTTNNRMELMAVITALEALREPCQVTVTSDSTYVVNAITKGWLASWQKAGFVRKGKGEVPNKELWQRLLRAMEPHTVEWVWVRGHNGHPYNERCDRLAVAAGEMQK